LKVLHFADLHLDAPFTWMGARGNAANRRRQGLCATLATILQVARERSVNAVFCGGDLYEHERFSPDTAAFLREAFAGIAPIPVYIAPGNHDWYGVGSLYVTTEWPANVHVFDEPALRPIEIDDGLTLWGGAHRAPAGTPNFLDGFQTGRGGINIALFHGSETGGFPGERDKQPHAPFQRAQIRDAGLHHAFLGHFHTPRDADSYTYPGNPSPLAFGEKGERGAVIATINADGTVERERVPVAQTCAHDLEVDITGCESQAAIRERVSASVAGLQGFARVTVSGELAPDVRFQESDLQDIDTALDYLQCLEGDVRVAYDFAQLRQEATVRGEFVRMVTEAGMDPDHEKAVLIVGLRALEGREDLDVA
jgi:DNA repair exonuclease SbcCD nuclease subunit